MSTFGNNASHRSLMSVASHCPTHGNGHGKRHGRSILTLATIVFALLVTQPVEAKKLKEWYEQKPKQALLTFSMRGQALNLNSLREMMLNRQDNKWQVLEHSAPNGAFPTAIFVVQDLGYTDAVFTAKPGEDLRPSTSLKQLVKDVKDLGEVGKTKNRYGKVDYQFYSSIESGQCLYTRQYGGWDASGDVRGGGTTLGSTVVHGFYCEGTKGNISPADVDDFIAGYSVDM